MEWRGKEACFVLSGRLLGRPRPARVRREDLRSRRGNSCHSETVEKNKNMDGSQSTAVVRHALK